ncbi:MAG: mycofactocin system FadH/OYE family oxidoreductase 2 [Syntrophobacterales bacterium]|nr:MAG: mycofactocin system FadH/OYE family oxidoreductase 2 [Syntrophobacterales bacterium]
MFNHLFKPLAIGHLTLPNRICFLAHQTNFARAGRLTDRHVAYYEERAKGGCGLIILGELSLHPTDRPYEQMIEAYEEKAISGFQELTSAIHRYPTKIFAQLNHSGFQCDGCISRYAVLGPSALSDIEFGETAKMMEPEDIREVVDNFAKAARYVKESGFDGIEVSLGHRSLLRQFLSPLSNYRQDEYGGNLENRMRFTQEVIDSVRKAAGKDFPIGIRLCADEMFYGAITLEDAREMARRFEAMGEIDFINVSVGTYYNLQLVRGSMHFPLGFILHLSQGIKEVVKIPVFANNRINTPQLAEEILSSGKADMVGLVRAMICDPYFPKKAKEGKFEDIFLCVADNQGCIGRVNQSKTIGCIQNPSVGYEREGEKEFTRTALKQKEVMIIGGGPAGMEAARVAAMRGHRVTLFEKEGELGGQINIAKKGEGRGEIGRIVTNLITHLKRLKVKIEMGVEVTEELVRTINPEVVIVATGSIPRGNPLPGRYSRSQVFNVWQVLKGEAEIGERVLLIDGDGHHKATSTAELLADHGRKVDIITDALFVGMELGPIGDLYSSRQRLLQKGVTFTADTRVEEINGTAVRAVNIYSNEVHIYDGYDTVVVIMANRPNDELYFRLKGKVRELYRIGDCVAPRKIDKAILEGNRVGRML